MKFNFAVMTALGVMIGVAAGTRGLLAQDRPDIAPKVYCTAGNIQTGKVAGAYGQDLNGNLNYNSNVQATFDCSEAQASSCAVCFITWQYSSAQANGDWVQYDFTMTKSGTQACGENASVNNVTTQNGLTPNTFYKTVVEISPALVTGTGGTYCDMDTDDYTTLATFYFDGNGQGNSHNP